MYDANKEEIFEIKGDYQSGISMGYDMEKTKIGEPAVRFRDRITWCDVYEMDGHLMVVWRCPRCTNDSNITTNTKRIEYVRGSDKITISPFGCNYEGCGLKLRVKNSVATIYDGPLK
jgi:hypothetical protein